MSQNPLITSHSFAVLFVFQIFGIWLGTFATDSVAQSFVDTGIPFVGLSEASAAWGDYDNDGDLDVVVCGFDAQGTARTILYRNDGGNQFTPVDAGLPSLGRGSLAWGDFDNDGYLDLLVIGVTSLGQATTSFVYRNDGGGAFHLAATLVTTDGST